MQINAGRAVLAPKCDRFAERSTAKGDIVPDAPRRLCKALQTLTLWTFLSCYPVVFPFDAVSSRDVSFGLCETTLVLFCRPSVRRKRGSVPKPPTRVGRDAPPTWRREAEAPARARCFSNCLCICCAVIQLCVHFISARGRSADASGAT